MRAIHMGWQWVGKKINDIGLFVAFLNSNKGYVITTRNAGMVK
jgi:hypothetical protein